MRPYIHSSMRLIGQRKVMWVEGEGGAWRLTENNRRGSKKKKKRHVCEEDGRWAATEADQENRQAADITQ